MYINVTQTNKTSAYSNLVSETQFDYYVCCLPFLFCFLIFPHFRFNHLFKSLLNRTLSLY